jgi:hypothetical protein
MLDTARLQKSTRHSPLRRLPVSITTVDFPSQNPKKDVENLHPFFDQLCFVPLVFPVLRGSGIGSSTK